MKTVAIFIEQRKYEVVAGLIKGQTLIELAGAAGSQQVLLERKDDIDIPILPDDYLIVDGGEKFSVGDGEPPIAENPCLRKPVKFFFNGVKVSGDAALKKPKITGAELLAFDPEGRPGDGLFADLDGADEPLRLNQRLIVQDKDRYITTPCGNVGYEAVLSGPLADHMEEVRHLYPDATLSQQAANYLLILPKHHVHEHWAPSLVDLLIVIPNGYPLAALDMFYVSPELKLTSGKLPSGAGHHEAFLKRTWQRFSWHYQRSWNPHKDSLISHIRFCMARLAKPE